MIAVPNYISPEEYLSIEDQSVIRHEYRRVLVYAMAGGTDNHDRITFNFPRNSAGRMSLLDCYQYLGNHSLSRRG